MDLAEISRINRARCDRWHLAGTPWLSSDWSNALAGESGELLEAIHHVLMASAEISNSVKKYRRHESGVSESYNTPDVSLILLKIRSEIADVFLYLDLVAYYFGWDLLDDCIRDKFNLVSEAQEFPERL